MESYEEKRVTAATQAALIQQELLAKAHAQQEASRIVADEAFRKMKIQIKEKERADYKARTVEERRRVELEIVLRAKEAQRAAAELKEAEARAKAAEEAWRIRMIEARRNAREEQERIRLEVMVKIESGSEAARIQAEANLRAQQLRETAYAQLRSSAQ